MDTLESLANTASRGKQGRPADHLNRMKDMARIEKARRTDRREKNALVFEAAEEVILWYSKKKAGPVPAQ